jgi:type IV pilus biogenesis/stability protein PilW
MDQPHRRAPLGAALSLLVTLVVLGLGACASNEPQLLEETSDYHVQLAGGHWGAGEVPQAIEELEIALAIDPNNAEAHYFLGFIFSGRRMYPDAIQHYRQALLLDPDRYDVQNNLGVVFLQMERWEEAEEQFQALTEATHYETPGHAYNNLGWAQYNQGRLRDALANFQMATYLEPDMCLAYNNQGIALEELGRATEAARAYEEAVTKCRTYAEPRLRLGRLLQVEGRWAESWPLLQQCVELAPNSNIGDRCREYLAQAGSRR